jgi:threonine aldolase
MRSLGSDNHSAVHPKIMEALLLANNEHAPAYGTDELSQKLESVVEDKCGHQWRAFHCFNGTAANVMSLKSLVKSYQSVLCTEVSHLNLDECGAPEAQIGCKLLPVQHENGKINLDEALKKISRLGDQHHSQVKALSITQPTELGTCYTLQEISKISDFCKKHKLYFHIDGARLPNAAFHLKAPLSEILKFADAVSFGGTKNGLLGSEMVLLKKEHAAEFKFIRKQSMQLPSKTKLLAAQFLAFFENDLYLNIAEHSCCMATYLAERIKEETPLKINYPVQSNAVFVNIPQKFVKELKSELFFYIWDDQSFEARLMTSFDTKKEELELFVEKIKSLFKEHL